MLRSRNRRFFTVEPLESRSLLSAYALTDLGSFGGGRSEAFDINSSGQVVGYAFNASNQRHAFLWQNGAMTDLGIIGGANRSEAYGLNSTGQVVGGVGSTLQLTQPEAFLWQNGAMTGLGVSNGGQANAINDSGQVAGTDGYNSGFRAFVWENGKFTYLGALGTQFQVSLAYDLNNNGTVVGTAATDEVLPEFGALYHAFVWQNGAMTDLGILPNQTESAALAINSLGQVVGVSDHIEEVTYHELSRKSFLYQNGQLIGLNVPGEHNSATDINDSGQIVGFMQSDVGATNNAYIYENGVAIDLNNLIPSGSGLHVTMANAINNAGQIVGTAVDSAGRTHAVLLNPTAAGTPSINIGDASVTEGNSGTRTAAFTVTLSSASSQPVTVAFGTANGTATAGDDYQAAAGTVTFAPGETTKTVSVAVNGDRVGEPNEAFLVNLSSATNAQIGDGQGTGTILDDEPRILISDVSRKEGNSGTTAFVFTVSLSAAYDAPVTVNFATADGTAKAGEDYVSQSGSITFAPGTTSKTITVLVNADKKKELNETFFVNLTGAVGGFILDGQGTGTILDDDNRP
jgi:probable HAF family extracellular repeat protein